VTSGGENGTSGAHRWPRPWLLVALIGVLVCAINASSELIEFARAGVDRDWWEPVLWEVSSAVILVGMAPLVGRAIRRWPPTPEGLVRFGLIHLGLTIPFALIHLAFIYVTRESIYWALGEHYGFFDDGIGVTSL